MMKWAIAAYIAGQSLDLGTTAAALHTGRAREANPVLKPAPMLMKVATSATVGVVLYRISRRRGAKKPVAILFYVLGGVGASAAVSNAHLLHGFAK